MLLLDEPCAGLAQAEVDELAALIVSVRDAWHIAVLLIEHNMKLVMRMCDQVVALDFGNKIADGPPMMVRQDEQVVRAYLGSRGRDAAFQGGAA